MTTTPTPSDAKYYPYTSLSEKVAAYKASIEYSLKLAVHPEHLKLAERKLKTLKEFWSEDIDKRKAHLKGASK